MSEWTPHVLTAAGRRLQAKVEAGLTLALTRMKLGSGQETIDEVDTLVDLVSVETELAISEAYANGEVCVVRGVLNTANLEHGFYCREWGIFADDPDEGEILYAVLVDEKPDWIPAHSPTELTITYCLNIAIANGTIIDAEVDPAGIVDVDMLRAATHAILRNTRYKAGSIVTASTLPHGLVLEAQTDGTTAATLVDLSGYACGDTYIDGTISWIVKRYVLTTNDEGQVDPGESCVFVKEITIPVTGWQPCTETVGEIYNVQIDIPVEKVDETMFPLLSLSISSLAIASEAVFCPSIKAFDGYVRLWAKRVPSEDLEGVLTILSAPLNGGAGAHIFTIPADAWEETENNTSGYGLQADVAVPRSTAKASPMVALDIASLAAARDAVLCSTIQAFDGFVRLWAINYPSEEIKGTITLFFDAGANPARLPTATGSILGGVKVKEGSGLSIDLEGNISIDAATSEEVLDVYDANNEQNDH